VAYLIDHLKLFLFVTGLLALECDVNILTTIADTVFYLVRRYAIILEVQIMLKPSVLIEIMCNYQPENCSNVMNYSQVYFLPWISLYIQFCITLHVI